MPKLTTHETIENRQHQAEVLSHLIDALADQYKVVAAETQTLSRMLFDANKRRYQGAVSVANDPVHGLHDLMPRVKMLIEHKLFGGADGATIDLPAIVKGENDRALRFIEQMKEVK